ncbi:MAG: hypothetical protein HYW69_03000 [Candidatus Nealsonbacteria bacterium]|nr:hypothetical protein [Candidatus Nealsonbacteria bacterium]
MDFLNSHSLKDIIIYFFSTEFQERLLFLKIAFLAVSGILLAIIVFLTLRTSYLKLLFLQDAVQFLTMRPFGAKRISKQWNKVLDRLAAGSEADYKLAIIEANDILDASLKRLGYDGAALEEKLGKLTSATLPNIKQLYEVHQLRNNIVHDPDYVLSLDETKKALDVFTQAFRDLQMLES